MFKEIIAFILSFFGSKKATDYQRCADSALLFTHVRCIADPLLVTDAYGSLFGVKKLLENRQFQTLFLRVQSIDKSEDKESVLRQQRLLEAVKHPNIQRLIEAKYTSSKAHFLMQYPGAQDLRYYMEINQSRPIDHKRVFKLFQKIAEAVQYLHKELKVVHGRLTDLNILMDSQEEPLISELRGSVDMGTWNSFRGVPGWMDPIFYAYEQGAAGFQFRDTMDVYSLGVILYQLYHDGETPFGQSWENKKRLQRGDFRFRAGTPFHVVCAVHACLQVSSPRRPSVEQLINLAKYASKKKTLRTITETLWLNLEEPVPKKISETVLGELL